MREPIRKTPDIDGERAAGIIRDAEGRLKAVVLRPVRLPLATLNQVQDVSIDCRQRRA